MLRRVLWGLSITLATVALAEPPRVERLPIVDRAIEFHGGGIYDRSETELRLCSGSGCYQVAVDSNGGLYEYRVSGPTSRGERRVRIDNETVEWWQGGEPRPVPADGEVRLRNWAMGRIYFCFLPYRLNDPGVFKQDLGLETWGERTFHKVKVTFGENVAGDPQDEYLYWLDPESGRVEQFAYSFTDGAGGLRFRRLYNYRRVGGILFFDQENLGVDGADLRVDQIDPSFVEERMRPISTVELREISVRPG